MVKDIKTTDDEAYCFNCGASHPTDSSIVTVGYRTGGAKSSFVKEPRPHCRDCANINNSVSNIFYIIALIIAAIFMIKFISFEWINNLN